jgi:hypothetical protein
MGNSGLSNHKELTLRIAQLKVEKHRQEQELKTAFSELIHSFHPVEMIKETVHELATDREVQMDLTKVGLNIGVNFIIDKIFGKNKSPKDELGSAFIESIANSLINKNMPNIFSGISRLFHRENRDQ